MLWYHARPREVQMNDITTTVQHPHGRNEKMTRSVDTLKELYTVAVGVALVMAVEKL